MLEYGCSLIALAGYLLVLARLSVGPRGRQDWIEVEAPMSERWMRARGYR